MKKIESETTRTDFVFCRLVVGGQTVTFRLPRDMLAKLFFLAS
jgi:hypothetical protein